MWKCSVVLSCHGLRQRMSSPPKVAAPKLFCAIIDLSHLSHKSLWRSYSYSQHHLWEVWLHWLIAMQRPFLAHSRLYPLLARARHPINSQQQQCFWLRGSVAASFQYSLQAFFYIWAPVQLVLFCFAHLLKLWLGVCVAMYKNYTEEIHWTELKIFHPSSTRLHKLWIVFLAFLSSTWEFSRMREGL